MPADDREIRLPLETAVLFCDKIFQKCRAVAKHPDWYDFPSLALFRHIVQMGDAIHILLSAGTSGPTIPLLRSMLESLMSLKYIHLDNYKQRSFCMLCAYIHEEIAIKEIADQKSEAGKKLSEVRVQEFKGWTPRPNRGSAKARNDASQLREVLKRPELAEIEAAWQELVHGDKFRRPPKWHKLLGGPTSIYRLAEEAQMLSLYKVFYQPWSSTVHGTDASRLLEGESGDFKELRVLENPEETETHAEIFLLDAAKLMRRKFLSDSDVNELLKWMKASVTDKG